MKWFRPGPWNHLVLDLNPGSAALYLYKLYQVILPLWVCFLICNECHHLFSGKISDASEKSSVHSLAHFFLLNTSQMFEFPLLLSLDRRGQLIILFWNGKVLSRWRMALISMYALCKAIGTQFLCLQNLGSLNEVISKAASVFPEPVVPVAFVYGSSYWKTQAQNDEGTGQRVLPPPPPTAQRSSSAALESAR